MTESFRGLIVWLIVLPVFTLVSMIFWIVTLGNSADFSEEVRFKIFRWARRGK